MLTALALPSACKEDPPDAAECPPGGTTGDLCEDVDEPEPPPPTCANPDFVGMHPPATKYECTGSAGGAIVYNQVIIMVGGSEKAGPGDVQTNPEVTEFPSMDANVSACCYGDPDEDEITNNVCESDCGRAACNKILEELRDRADNTDPSNGKCDALVAEGPVNSCRARILTSIESWIAQIEGNYEQCVNAAINNDDPMLPYTDIETPFGDDFKLAFVDSDCDQNAVGCLFQAELRPFCQIDSFTEQMSCNAAGNPEDPEADEGAEPDSSGGGGGVVDPFGDIDAAVNCNWSTLACTVDYDLIYDVGGNFQVFYNEGVALSLGTWATGVTGLKITGLSTGEDSKELCDAFFFVNNDVITHVNGTLIDAWNDVDALLDDFDTRTSWTVRVRRKVGTVWKTRNYSVTIPISISNADAGEPLAAAADDGPSNGGDPTGESSGCGCTHASDRGPAGPPLFMLALIGLARRRRR